MSEDETPQSWTKIKLDSIVVSAVDGPFGSNLKSEHYVDQPGVRVVRLQNIGVSRFLDNDRAYVSSVHAAQLSRHTVEPGDLLVASLGDDAHPVARTCQYPAELGPAIVKADCFRLRLDKKTAQHEFVRWLLNSDSARSSLLQRAHGVTRDRVNLTSLKGLAITLPSLPEQQKIAEILDRVDEAISSTECLIAKCRNIAEATTSRLLNPAGNSPQWDLRPLQSVSSISGGVTLGRTTPASQSVELPYLRVANVQDGYIDLNEVKTVRILTSEINRYALQAGDVLMTEGGDFDKLGRGAVWNGEITPCLHQNHIFRVRCDQEVILPEFLAAYSRSHKGRQYFLDSAKQTTNLASINMTQLSRYPVPVPPLDVQESIVEVTRSTAGNLSAQQIELRKLRKVKQGLMEDLLTGRVRVKVN